MDPFNAPSVGWFDVEVSPDHPRRAQQQQQQQPQPASLFPRELPPPPRPPVMNMAAVFQEQQLQQRLREQQQAFLLQQQPRQRIMDVEVVSEQRVRHQQQQRQQQQQAFLQKQHSQQRNMDVEVDEDSSSNPLQDYLENLILRVEGRGSSGRGGPLHSQELMELALHASRDDSAFVHVDADTMTTITQWLYEQVLHATTLSILNEAGRVFAEDAAPSQAMAALQTVRSDKEYMEN